MHRHEATEELERLVERQEYPQLLSRVSLQEIAEAWHCYNRRGAEGTDDPDWWAIEFWLGPGPEATRLAVLAWLHCSLQRRLTTKCSSLVVDRLTTT